jgi:hypothetical protein
MVSALPGEVLRFPSAGFEDSTVDVPDAEQATSVNSTVKSAAPAAARRAHPRSVN